MGIDLSVNVGYGFAGMPEEMPAEWPDLEAWQDGDVTAWLHEQGLGTLYADVGGDQMSGPWGRWQVVVRGTYVSIGGRDYGPVLTRLKGPDVYAVDQLVQAREALGVDVEMGWMVLVDVT